MVGKGTRPATDHRKRSSGSSREVIYPYSRWGDLYPPWVAQLAGGHSRSPPHLAGPPENSLPDRLYPQ